MPITIAHPLRVLDQKQLGAIAYELIELSFAIHNELGRFFDEDVYQNELLQRLGPRATKEVWIHVTHGDAYESHLRRLLQHTPLRRLLWVNVTLDEVAFVCVEG